MGVIIQFTLISQYIALLGGIVHHIPCKVVYTKNRFSRCESHLVQTSSRTIGRFVNKFVPMTGTLMNSIAILSAATELPASIGKLFLYQSVVLFPDGNRLQVVTQKKSSLTRRGLE